VRAQHLRRGRNVGKKPDQLAITQSGPGPGPGSRRVTRSAVEAAAALAADGFFESEPCRRRATGGR
jgi:hypothetical protein